MGIGKRPRKSWTIVEGKITQKCLVLHLENSPPRAANFSITAGLEFRARNYVGYNIGDITVRHSRFRWHHLLF